MKSLPSNAQADISLTLGILGFGVSGFDRVVTERIPAFSVNPLQNVVHVAVGLGLVWVVYRSPWALPGAATASLLYLMLGVVGWSAGIDLLAMNPATAELHVAMGSLGLLLLVATTAADRRHPERDARGGSAING